MISLAVLAAGWVVVLSPGDYAILKFPPLSRHSLFWIGLAIALFCFSGLGMSVLSATSGEVLLPLWHLDSINLKSAPFRLLVPMRKTTRIAYETTQGSLWADAAERTARDMNSGIDAILGYYATALVGSGDKMKLWDVARQLLPSRKLMGKMNFPSARLKMAGTF